MIELKSLTAAVGGFALDGISLRIESGETGVLMGRTGSGKTTILECICGLRPVRRGAVEVDGVDVTRFAPAARGVGYVPQDGALFRAMTVAGHLGLALRARRAARSAVRRRVGELAELLGIEALLDRRPPGLSGGERQRVALGRALAAEPRILCLDEPLSALDEQSREELYAVFERVKREHPLTILHVTHSSAEARRLADRLLVLESGAVRVRPLAPVGDDLLPGAGHPA